MPGFEILGAEERAEVLDTMSSGVLMRYGFDGARQGRWRAVELEEFYSVKVLEFRRMLDRHAIEIPQGITRGLTEAQVNEMIRVALSLTPLWENALGKDWPAQMTPDKARELFARM